MRVSLGDGEGNYRRNKRNSFTLYESMSSDGVMEQIKNLEKEVEVLFYREEMYWG